MLTALLLGLCGAWSHIEWGLGTPFLGRPLVLGPIVGIILGDLGQGLIIGATIEVFFLGSMAIGSYIPPDSAVGGVLGTAFAIKSGLGPEVGLSLAIPIAIIATSFQNVLWSVNSLTSKVADKKASEGNAQGVHNVMFFEGIMNILLKFFLVFFAWQFGSERVVDLLAKVPPVFIEGMSVVGGILPALGLAMLMRMIMTKKVAPYYLLGFALAAYLNVPVLGLAVFGTILVLVQYNFSDVQTQPGSIEGGTIDDDF